MEPRIWPFFLGAMGLLVIAGVPIVKTTAKDSKTDQQIEVKEESSKKEEKDSDKESPQPWCEIASLYWEYFGNGDRPICGEQDEGWSGLRQVLAAKPQDYELSFLIATVPEPIDSFLPANFDQALQGIQQAYASSGYLLDRMWLPWNDKDLIDSKAHRRFPGILLFRRTNPLLSGLATQSKLATVFLVGESPKSGVHKEALRSAVVLASTFSKDPKEISILGPSFSGSDQSLHLFLKSAAKGTVRFRIVTGTASVYGLEGTLGLPEISDFCRTMIPDGILQEVALRHLREEMGWDRRRVANLVEADTAYGQLLFRTRSKWKEMQDRREQEGPREGPLLIKFPSGISDIRIAWEKNRGVPAEARAVLKEPKLALDLSLAGEEKPTDLVPKLSPLSVQGNDLALSNLLRSISREQVNYVGILASDVRDKLFLAKQVQRFLPDVVLFTLEGDLLYSHPEIAETMDGMLVFSSSPLITEGQPWLPSLGSDSRERRQFSSEFHRGFFKAASYLLSEEGDAPSSLHPQVWISAVGNGAVWPLARVSLKEEEKHGFSLCGIPTMESSEHRNIWRQDAAERRDLQILLVLGALILLAQWLSRVVIPPDLVQEFCGRGGGAKLAKAKAWALALGIAVLWISGASLVGLGFMPWWVRSFHAISEIFTVMLGLGYIALVWNLGRIAWPSFEPAVYRLIGGGRQNQVLSAWVRISPFLIWIFLGLMIPALFAWGLWLLAKIGGAELFYFRARAFSSGLSPFISMSWLGGALYTWACLELLRYRILVRHLAEWPLQQYSEPSLRHLPETVKDLGKFLRGTLGPNWFFLAGAAFALIPPIFLIGKTVQPIAEPKYYGRAFLALCFVSLILAAVSFQRFWKIWRLLEKVLQRLEHSPIVDSFRSVSDQVAWNPMKSFWQVPVFNVLLLSLQKLHKIVDRLKGSGHPSMAQSLTENVIYIEEALDDAFEARRNQEIRDEIRARWKIQDTLLYLCKELNCFGRDPLVQELFSIRIVSYIRHVFSHMRSSLLAAMLGSFLTLVAVSSYAFEPKQFISLAIWGVILLGVILTVWTFVQMDRNAVLSAISGTDPGRVTFNRSFILNILTYGILPIAGVVVTQFPDLGSMITRWLNPLLQVAGVD